MMTTDAPPSPEIAPVAHGHLDAYASRVLAAIRYATGGAEAFQFPQSMLWGFEGEDVGDDAVRYLRTEEERAPFEVRIAPDGRLYWLQTGEWVDSREASRPIGIVTLDGRVFVCLNPAYDRIQHSSFQAGDDVAAGFEFETDRGYLAMITPATGHYGTPQVSFRQVVRFFNAMGVTGKVSLPPASQSKVQRSRVASQRLALRR